MSHNYTADQLLQILLTAAIKVDKMRAKESGLCCLLGLAIVNTLAPIPKKADAAYPRKRFAAWDVSDMLVDTVFRNIVEQWPDYSGDTTFPVPGPVNRTIFGLEFTRMSASTAFHNLPKWRGAYGQSRQELLDFTIESLQIALGKRK